MPPAAKKDVSVILFDLKTEERAKAIQTLLKISCYHSFTISKDLTKLILLSSKQTANRLNARSGGYNYINEVVEDVILYDPERMLELIDQNNETEEANWIEGLLVALKNLEEETEHINGIVTYQILFITDLKTPLSKCDKSLIDKVVQGFKKLNAFLYVVGPDVVPPFTIKSAKHVKLWMENLVVDEDNQNLTVLKNIITNTPSSVVCNYSMGSNIIFSLKNLGGTQPWQVPLAIGSKIDIPASTMKILDESIPCKLTNEQGAIRDSMWIDAEDESIEVDFTDVISGIMRHEKFVQMPDNKMFQVQNPRSFSVLCFTDSVNVPEYLMRGGGCYCVLPDVREPEKQEAMHILIDCLANQNKYVIARRIYNANYVPKIVVLVPKPDYKPKCFLLTALPYAEDIRLSYKERKLELAPKVAVKEEIYDFLDVVNIENDVSKKRVPLGINMMQSINVTKILNKAADKLLDKHMSLEEIDIDLFETPSGVAFEALKNIWPERTLEQIKEKEDKNDESDDEFDWS